MVEFRAANQDDLEAFYAISLMTGHYGANASNLYDDPKMMGHIYSAPYLTFSPELCFVAEDEDGVAGFIVGALDTRSFEDQLEKSWWPALREVYAMPDEAEVMNWTADQRRSAMIHQPAQSPIELVNIYPAHLHMNLLPRIQGRGLGLELLNIWCTAASGFGARKAHVGANAQNRRAVKFWQQNRFEPLGNLIDLPQSRIVWLGRSIYSSAEGRPARPQ